MDLTDQYNSLHSMYMLSFECNKPYKVVYEI